MKLENNASIPSIKYPTKEDLKAALDDLKAKYNNLNYDKEQLQEKLYESGVDSRPTIMSQIFRIESQARDSIIYTITECEKETGRDFPWEIIF
jgi:hypothetical protein